MRKTICLALLITVFSVSMPLPAGADMLLPKMPSVGTMVHLSPTFTPAHLSGMTIHPDNALKFDFLIHRGDAPLADDAKAQEYTKLVKYFLASLTIPDEDQWVNLSPYEKDRIIKDNFGKTEMGRDLLAQDYMLKQITASLIYPEDSLGKKFWDKIYERAWKEYGSTEVPVNTFNKVWIIPDEAVVYESGNTAYVLRNRLKVMLESDYLALEKNKKMSSPNAFIGDPAVQTPTGPVTAPPYKSSELGKLAPPVYREPVAVPPVDNVRSAQISAQIIKEIILPELEKEVNEGKNFANLRQIYSGMILATWYKNALKESLLSKVYANQAKVKGINQDPQSNEAIYQQYLKAFKKGVFNYIKEDVDKYTKQEIPRKYFSGGTNPFTGFQRDPALITPGKVSVYSQGKLPSRIITTIAPAVLANDIDRASIALETNEAMMAEYSLYDTAQQLIEKEFANDPSKKIEALEHLDRIRENPRKLRSYITNINSVTSFLDILTDDVGRAAVERIYPKEEVSRDWKPHFPGGRKKVFRVGKQIVRVSMFTVRDPRLTGESEADFADRINNDRLIARMANIDGNIDGLTMDVLEPVIVLKKVYDDLMASSDSNKRNLLDRIMTVTRNHALADSGAEMKTRNLGLVVRATDKGKMVFVVVFDIQGIKNSWLTHEKEVYLQQLHPEGIPLQDVIPYIPEINELEDSPLQLPDPAMSQNESAPEGPKAAVNAGQQWQWNKWDEAVGQLRGELYLAKKGDDFDILVSYVDDEEQSHDVTLHEISLLDAKGKVALSNHNRESIEPSAGEVFSIAGMDSEGRVIIIEKPQFKRLTLSYKSPITAEMMMHVRGPGQISLSEIVSRLKTLHITKVQAALIFQEFDHHYVGSGETKSIDQPVLQRFSHYLARELQYGEAKIPFIMEAIKVIFYYPQGELRSPRDSQRYRQAVIDAIDEAMTAVPVKLEPIRQLNIGGGSIPVELLPGLQRDFLLNIHSSRGNVSITFSISRERDGSFKFFKNGQMYMLQPRDLVFAFEAYVRMDEMNNVSIIRIGSSDDVYSIQEQSLVKLPFKTVKVFNISNGRGEIEMQIWKNSHSEVSFRINGEVFDVDAQAPEYVYTHEALGINFRIRQNFEGFEIINQSSTQQIIIEEQLQTKLEVPAVKLLRFIDQYKGDKDRYLRYIRLLGVLGGESDFLGKKRIEDLDISRIQEAVIDKITLDLNSLRWDVLMSQHRATYLPLVEELELFARSNVSVSAAMISMAKGAVLNRGDSTQTQAMSSDRFGGIDFNPANLDLLIKRDGNGVPLPVGQQDMAQLMQVEGFIPVILAITPALNVPILTELQHQIQPALR